MNYWCGSRVTTNLSSITDPAVLDGSTGKVHFFGISTGAGSPQVVQTDTALGSVVTATVGNANSPQVHAGTLRSITPTSPVPAEPVTCMCAAMTTPARTIQRFTVSISPPASCQIRTMETRCRSGRVPEHARRSRKSTIPAKARARIGSSSGYPATAPSVDPPPDAWNPSISLQDFRQQQRRQALPVVERAASSWIT